MNLTQKIILSGGLSTLVVFLVTIIRHRRFESKDIAVCLGAFFAGANFPPSVFLCLYGMYPDPATSQTRLYGFEWYLSFAGIAAFLFGLDALVASVKKAYYRAD